ncbi:MAG: hypothetical protein ACQETL_13785 [Bacteroidota bacterium]
MSIPKIYNKQIFEPRLQTLHKQLDPLLKMLFKLTKAEQVFLSFWNEDYNQVYNKEKGFFQPLEFDGQQLKQKFKLLFSEVIYVPNARLHTLIQDLPFFSEHDKSANVFLLPLIIKQDNRIGVLGLNMPQNENFDFDQTVHQIEIIGQHIVGVFDQFLSKISINHSNKVNFDLMPASFMNFSINKNAELLDCNFSKHLMRKHPAFKNYSCDSKDMIESLLQMDLSAFAKMLMKFNNNQNIEYVYPYVLDKKEKKYFVIKIHVSLSNDGVYQCLAFIDDISIHRAYNTTLDQILFDISHVMRRPVVSMKGLTNLIDLNQFDRNEIYEIAGKLKVVSEEMEDYIKAMFKMYEAKQEAEYYL